MTFFLGGHVLGRLPEVVELDGHRTRVSTVEDARIAELVIEPTERSED